MKKLKYTKPEAEVSYDEFCHPNLYFLRIEIMSSEDKSLTYVENRYKREEKPQDTTVEDTTNDKNWGKNEE